MVLVAVLLWIFKETGDRQLIILTYLYAAVDYDSLMK